jgi:Proteasome assembly chaperone 3
MASSSSSLLVSSNEAERNQSDSKDSTHFAVPTKEHTCTIEGEPTSICVMHYADKVVVLVTQTGKLGSWFQASFDSGATQLASGASDESRFTVQTLLGRRDDETLAVFARQLIERIAVAYPGKSLLLSLTLKRRDDIASARALLNEFKEHELL